MSVWPVPAARLSYALIALTLVDVSWLGAQCPDGSPPPCVSAQRILPAAPRPVPELRRLSTSGRISIAQLSDDGRLLAYVEDSVLYVSTLLTGSRPVVVSREPWRFRSGIWWSSDNSRFLTRGDSGWFLFPSLGGLPRLLSRIWSYASVSRDGRSVLLTGSLRSGEVINLETDSVRSLTIQHTDTWNHEHAWSPDGQHVVVVTSDGRRFHQLQVASVATGLARSILRDSVPLASPRWDSWTGSIAYLRVTATGAQLWRQRVSSTGAPLGRPRLVIPLFEGTPVFQLVDSGRHLAFLRVERVENYVVRGLGADTTNQRLTHDATQKPLAGEFSPDGRSIAYVHVDAAGHNVWLGRADSGPSGQVTTLRDRSIASLSWSPDGRRMALCTNGETGRSIQIVSVETREIVSLPTRNLGDACQFAWGAADVVLYQLNGNRNFSVFSLTTRSERRLVRNDSVGFMFDPALESNSGRVAVTRTGRTPGLLGVWLIGLRDSLRQRIANYAQPIRFSPDGSTLFLKPFPTGPAFFGENREVVIRLRLGETVAWDVVPRPADCDVLDVSPDGQRALCRVTESIRHDVWLIRNFDPDLPATVAPLRP